MRKLYLLFLMLLGSVLNTMSQISFDEVATEAWIGTGPRELVFIVDFDPDSVGTDSAFAWGIRFENDSLTGIEIMDLIAGSDENFTYTVLGGFLDNISYTKNNQVFTNPYPGWFSVLESPDGITWAWNSGIGDVAGDGQWFGIVAMDPVSWLSEINVPLIGSGAELTRDLVHNIKFDTRSEQLFIDLPENAEISLINTGGRIVFSTLCRNETIRLSGFSPGLYIVTVSGRNIHTNKKIWIK